MNDIQFSGGFLDKNMEVSNIDVIHGYNKKEFEFLYKLNQKMYDTIDLFDGNVSSSGASGYIISCFVMIHKTFQAIVILLERGLQDEALALLRIIFEKIIYAKCAMNKKLFLKVQLNGITKQIESINKVKQHDFTYRQLSDEELENKKNILISVGQNILDAIDSNRRKPYNGKTKYGLDSLADAVGMTDQYKYMYPVLNKMIHCDMTQVEAQIETDMEGHKIIDLNPIFEDNHYYTNSISNLITALLDDVYNYFGFSKENITPLLEEESKIWHDLLYDC